MCKSCSNCAHFSCDSNRWSGVCTIRPPYKNQVIIELADKGACKDWQSKEVFGFTTYEGQMFFEEVIHPSGTSYWDCAVDFYSSSGVVFWCAECKTHARNNNITEYCPACGRYMENAYHPREGGKSIELCI